MHTMQLFAPLLLAMALASHTSAGCIGRWDTYGETCGKLSPTPGRCRRAGAHCDERRWGPDMCVVACAPTISRPSPSPPYYNRPYPSPSPPARPVNTLQSRSQCNAIVKAAYVAVLCRAADDSGLRHHTDRCMKEGHGYIVATMRSSVEFKGCARCQQPGCGRGVNVMAQTPGGVPPAMVTLARLEGIWFVCRTCELATAIVGAATGAGVMPQAFEPCAGNRAATSARALFFSFARAHWLAMTSERPRAVRPQWPWQRPHGGVAPRIIFMCQAGLGGAGCSAQVTTGAPNKRLGD